MHVCWWEFECVFEALFFGWALVAEGSCALDVGDVFVGFGEHEVGFAFAGGVFHPVVSLYS